MKNKNLTKEQVVELNAKTCDELRNSYQQMMDGLSGLEMISIELPEQVRKQIAEVAKAARTHLADLNHL